MLDILKLGYSISRQVIIPLDRDSKIMKNLKKICNSEDFNVEELKKRVLHPLEQLDRQIRIKLHDKENNIDLDSADVGLGIPQVIPVLVGALHSDRPDPKRFYLSKPPGGFFAVEQPELHLHPAAQVALGDVFIDCIKYNRDHPSRKNSSYRTMLIETHSEHLLLRLLRRVRETTRRSRHQTTDLEQTAHELTPNDLSVVYVRPTPAGVKFTPLTVTDNGDFDAPWPEGFFDERDSELF